VEEVEGGVTWKRMVSPFLARAGRFADELDSFLNPLYEFQRE
jgi:hypothetical protein